MASSEPGWSLRWYREVWADERWIEAFWTSFQVACVVTVLSVAIGLPASFALVRGSVSKHVSDIAEKYLIPGEVQTPAIMFVPSEAIYAAPREDYTRKLIAAIPQVSIAALETQPS